VQNRTLSTVKSSIARSFRSKALVRHGADPGEALAGVLGVRAGDIRVRDVSGSTAKGG
jgi:hypothetical protein